MATKIVQQSLPEIHLQRTFENAVRDISQSGKNGKPSHYRMPIVQRTLSPLPLSSADAEKRALTDAAKALAQLWKVGPSFSR